MTSPARFRTPGPSIPDPLRSRSTSYLTPGPSIPDRRRAVPPPDRYDSLQLDRSGAETRAPAANFRRAGSSQQAPVFRLQNGPAEVNRTGQEGARRGGGPESRVRGSDSSWNGSGAGPESRVRGSGIEPETSF